MRRFCVSVTSSAIMSLRLRVTIRACLLTLLFLEKGSVRSAGAFVGPSNSVHVQKSQNTHQGRHSIRQTQGLRHCRSRSRSSLTETQIHGDNGPDASTETDDWERQQLSKGLARMEILMSNDFFDQCGGTLQQLKSHIVKHVAVKESSIPGAGKGLFATKNIKAGTIVSFYPAHTLGMETANQEVFVYSSDDDKEHFRQHPHGTSSYLHATDQSIFRRTSFINKALLQEQPGTQVKDIPLYLDVNPGRPISPIWLSQFINDGAALQSNTEDGVSEYYAATKATKNCVHIPFGPSPVMATISTRKIKKGDELFTSYGCVYWLGVLFNDDSNSPAMTNTIQQQIRESANDLFASMESASVRYATQIAALEEAFDGIAIS